MKLRAGAAALGLVLLGACGAGTGQGVDATPDVTPEVTTPAGDVLLRFGDEAVAVEVAATPQEQQRGLMFREELAEDAGMLFIFPAAHEGGFWMKNTLIPLSIAYMSWGGDDTFEVVSIVDMEPCRNEDCPSYPSDAPYDAALEVNQGWFERHGVSEGDEAQVEGELPTPT